MQIGIGVPNPVPGVPGTRLVDWARRAEERGFSGLATIDRVVYPSHDSLATLAAAAGATTRIGLLTNILLGPLYPTVHLARAAASVDQLSGGRFTLGVAPGGRPDDFEALGLDFHARGRDLDAQLDQMHRIWRGDPRGSQRIGPSPVAGDRVPVMVGGTSDAALRRVADWGAGWAMGGGPPEMGAPVVARVRGAWAAAGRTGEPRLSALAYYSLGADAEAPSREYLRDYYGYLGDYTEMIASGALRSTDAIRGAVQAFEDAGFTELYFDPTSPGLDQVDRLADIVL
jgi:alkanesulfonate monooxygenase SsuD/methylene tetrahydromethanopterin reductase-like flavin-dependent oxidoreductase (luciferase family)